MDHSQNVQNNYVVKHLIKLSAFGLLLGRISASGSPLCKMNFNVNVQLSATDVSDLITMKNAANCSKQYDLRTSENH